MSFWVFCVLLFVAPLLFQIWAFTRFDIGAAMFAHFAWAVCWAILAGLLIGRYLI